MPLAQLHEYIQIAFDWSGEHLHSFRIHGKDYGISYLGGISFDDKPNIVQLSRFRLHLRESFRYEYDFTANWRVDIRLEKIVSGRAAHSADLQRGKAGGTRRRIRCAARVLATVGPSLLRVSIRRIGNNSRSAPAWLDAGGDRRAISDVEEVGEAAERVTALSEVSTRSF